MTDITAIPQCGISCFLSALPTTDCGNLLNTTCLCANQAYKDVVGACVVATCRVGEQLAVEITTQRNCAVPVSNRSGNIAILQGIVTPIQDILFFMRIADRVLHKTRWGADDITIILAWLMQNGLLGAGIIASRKGIGHDVWGLKLSQILETIQLFFAFEIVYPITLGLIKAAMCFCYLRIFPEKNFRRAVWGTQLFNVVLVFILLIVDFCQCRPLNWFWNRLRVDTTETGICIDINAMLWTHGILNIVLDVWLLALPASQILGLQMRLGKKLRVMSMFALGILITVVSCIRLRSLINYSRTRNPTQDFYDLEVWSAIELTTGVCVVCLPGASHLTTTYMPSLRTAITGYASKVSRDGSMSSKPIASQTTSAESRRGLEQSWSNEISMDTVANDRFSQHHPRVDRPDSYPPRSSSYGESGGEPDLEKADGKSEVNEDVVESRQSSMPYPRDAAVRRAAG